MSEQQTPPPSGLAIKVVIIVLVAAALVTVVAIKQHNRPPADQPPTGSQTMDGPAAPLSPETPGMPSEGRTALPVLVDLGAGKCIPCKMMAPILEELKQEYTGQLDVKFIDVWVNPDAAAPYNIKIIPTQIFYDAGGRELFRHEGFFAKADILAKWKELGTDLAAPAVGK
ncbi:MAG: thioredoxin family protein [Planctomycetota bacterium]